MHPRQAALKTALEKLVEAPWENPLTSEGYAPPYLPEKQAKVANTEMVLPRLVAAFDDLEMAELGALVAILRAASTVHQTHHWQTKGSSSYGDHLLFERLYNDSQDFIDQVAERALGQGHPALVSAVTQARLLSLATEMWCKEDDVKMADGMVSLSLEVEKCVVECINMAIKSLEAKGQLSNGTDNLLQGIADKHEEFMYLLQQRVGGVYNYDYR